MRSLFWLLAVFAAAVALVVLGRVNAGYVLFVYPPWRVEFTMLAFAIAAAASFFLLYGLFRLVGQAVSLPTSVRAYRRVHHMQAGVGHYGVFSGRKWNNEIYPLLRDFVHVNS